MPEPPSTHLDKHDLRALENTRARYAQLTYALDTFANTLQCSEGLIPWPNQQTQFSILSSNLESLAKTISAHFPSVPPSSSSAPQNGASIMGTGVGVGVGGSQNVNLGYTPLTTFPNPSFPAREQETLLGMLLRKKLQPQVEEWVESGRKRGGGGGGGEAGVGEEGGEGFLGDEEINEFWKWAGEAVKGIGEGEKEAGEGADGDEEEEEEDDEGEEEEEELETVAVADKSNGDNTTSIDKERQTPLPALPGPPFDLSQIFRFWSTGQLPAPQPQQTSSATTSTAGTVAPGAGAGK